MNDNAKSFRKYRLTNEGHNRKLSKIYIRPKFNCINTQNRCSEAFINELNE